jgi:hypothetical protein
MDREIDGFGLFRYLCDEDEWNNREKKTKREGGVRGNR